jgi:hypothetical protein
VSSVSGFSTSGVPRYIFLTVRPNIGSSMPARAQQGLMIIDLKGDLVWWRQISNADPNPFNLRPQVYNGENVLTWFAGKAPEGVGVSGSYPLYDSTYTQIAAVSAVGYPSDLHEFLLTSEGTALLTAYQSTGTASTDPSISHAQEVDVATGKLIFDWASYPAVPVSDSYVGGQDYFHINSVDLWPGSARNLLISSRNTSTVYLVDRATKKIIWQLGGKHSSFKLGSGVAFNFQHDARALSDGSGLSIYDDESGVSGQTASAKVISLDMTTMTATLRHRYEHTTAAVTSPYTGNNQLLATGGHFVDFGGSPYFTVFGATGSELTGPILFDGRLPDNVFTYRTFLGDWTGRPSSSEIGFKVYANGNDHYTAHCSWNGATEIATWVMRVGATDTQLAPVTSSARQGFETTMRFTYTGAKYFQATAVDSAGNALGDTPVVEVS